MKKLKLLVALVCSMIAASACNTLGGVGKDIKKGGEVIEKAATK